jgi:hypothetical protein
LKKPIQDEKRSYPRRSSHIYIKLAYGQKVFNGVVMNLSKTGMSIKSSKRLPIKSKSTVFIPLIQVVLKIPVKIVRLIKTNNKFYGMGVQVLKSEKKYADFVENLKQI